MKLDEINDEMFIKICKDSFSYKDVFDTIGYKRFSNVTFTKIKNKISNLGIDVSHFIQNDAYLYIHSVPKTTGVYMIKNLNNGKVYVGQAKNLQKRLLQHLAAKTDKPLHKEIQKDGIDSFEFRVLEVCEKSELDSIEQKYIRKFNSTDEKYGYNISPGGNATKLTEDVVLQIINDLRHSDLNSEEIGDLYNVSGRTIRSINTGEYCRIKGIEYPIRDKLYTIPSFLPVYHECPVCKKFTTNKIYCSQRCEHIKSRKAVRASRNELKNMIRTSSFLQVGKKFGVSDNTIRKWCKSYSLPYKSSEISKYSDEEWDNI